MIRLSDPNPAFCSACHNAPDGRYVDFDAAHDGGDFVDAGTFAYVEGTDDLHLCEGCVRTAMEVLALKPQQHQNLLRENRRLEAAASHWRDENKKLAELLAARPEELSSRRKVAA